VDLLRRLQKHIQSVLLSFVVLGMVLLSLNTETNIRFRQAISIKLNTQFTLSPDNGLQSQANVTAVVNLASNND